MYLNTTKNLGSLKIPSVVLAILLVAQSLGGVLLYPASVNAITSSSAISLTNFGAETTHDYVSTNTTSFSRNSVKTNYQSGVDTAANTPQYENTIIASPQEMSVVPAHEEDGPVSALEVCRNGYVWGVGNTSGSKHNRIYYMNPAGSPSKWTLVKNFGGFNWVNSIHCSLKSGYLFVGTSGGNIWRSVTADGTDNFEPVYTLESNTMGSWSFTDKADGTIWISEYGGDKDGDSDDAIRVYRSTNEGAVGSWSKIFDFEDDFPADFHAGMHLHKIIYNPYNNTLYMAHGDTDPNYIYKSAGGTGSNWQKINFRYEYYSGGYIYFQPTAAVVQLDGNILWFDDAARRGIWIQDVSDDSFSYINPSIMGNQFFYDAKVIDGIVYAPTQTSSADRNEILVFPLNDPYSFIFIDHVNSGETGQGWAAVAGKGNDGYVYFSYRNGSESGTKKYKAVTLGRITGLSVDPRSNNQHLDPFANLGAKSGGWSTYAADYYSATGGKYKDSHMIAKAITTNKMKLTNLIDPVVLSFWARTNGLANDASSIRIYPKQYLGDTFLENASAIGKVAAEYVSDDYWKKYTIILDTSTLLASTTKLAFEFSPASGGDFKIDGVYMEQIAGGREKLAQLTREADRFQTVLKNPLPTINTILGVASARYQFDTENTYTLFEAKNSDTSKWIKLVVHDNQIKLIDNNNGVSSPIIQTSAGIPEQIRDQNTGDPPQDIYYWALKFYADGGAKTRLYLSTQRTNLESIAPVKYALSDDLTIIYDGSSHTVGEEIGGTVIKREIFSRELTLAAIKQYWQSTTMDPEGIFKNVINTVSAEGYTLYSSNPVLDNLVRISLTPSSASVTVKINTWQTSAPYSKKWTESSTPANRTSHTISDLSKRKYYTVWYTKNGGAKTRFATSQANDSGEITFTYDKGYSDVAFEIKEDTTGPAAFTLSSPSKGAATSNTKPTFSWKASSDAESGLAKYQLYINGSLDTDNISGTSVTPAKALSCGSHNWYVRAVDNAGNYTNSRTSALTIGPCRVPLVDKCKGSWYKRYAWTNGDYLSCALYISTSGHKLSRAILNLWLLRMKLLRAGSHAGG